MLNERQAFLAAIEEDPRNLATRKIFADWLDENGTDADAAHHRGWTLEKQDADEFMDSFATHLRMTKSELLAVAKRFLLTGQRGVLGFDTPDRVYDDNEEFWQKYQLLTGEVVPDGEQNVFFSCVC
jgi:uncharacterized protein (TIGR02996 family)